MKDLLLEVDALSVYAGETRLLEPLSSTLTASQPLTILGQTGAGKSLLAQAIMGLLPDALSVRGDVRLNGESLFSLSMPERQALWGRVLSMLPQEPWHALDPVMKVKRQVAEVHHYVLGQEQEAADVQAEQALQRLGLEGALAKIPSQLSGGDGTTGCVLWRQPPQAVSCYWLMSPPKAWIMAAGIRWLLYCKVSCIRGPC